MLYTRKGDDGTSGLFGSKARIAKDDLVYEALGSLDELNSLLGVCRARAANEVLSFDLSAQLLQIQETLFIMQATLAGAEQKIEQSHLDTLEKTIEQAESLIQNPHSFVIPGSTELSGFLDLARAVSRRTERALVAYTHEHTLPPAMLAYANRLSSALYAFARYAATHAVAIEPTPHY